jgi:hypothetical protein
MKAYNQALVDFMEKKGKWMQEELSIPSTWYFSEGDRDDIMNWDEKDAKRVWEQIKANVKKHKCSGLRYEFCPFCHKYDYKHQGCSKVLHNQSCLICTYGKRHGMCTDLNEGASQYRQILRAFEDDRIDIYRFFSESYYHQLIDELDNMIERSYLHPMNEFQYK